MNTNAPLVSINLFTRNRREELQTALESCLAQDYRPLEVLVFDDASTDGTEEAARAAFPEARFFREETQRGIAAMRNRGLQESAGEFVFSIDDDAYYTDASTVGRVVEQFRREPRTAVVALPFVEPLREARDGAALRSGDQLRAFISCAYAIRRGAALEAGGYREFFFYRGEERDLSLRLLQAGYSIVYGNTPPVVHLYSPKRAWDRMFALGIRNNLLFDWLNIPHPYVLPRLLLDAAALAAYKVTLRQFPARLAYLARGLLACARYTRQRAPVSRSTYVLYRSLPGHGAAPAPAVCPAPARRVATI